MPWPVPLRYERSVLMKVILVDHNPAALRRLTTQVQGLGCGEVICCASALEVIRVLEQERAAVALVVCDLGLPGMDGLLRHLARLKYKGRIAVLSGDESSLQTALRLAQAHRLNVVAALRKPVSSHMLAGAMIGVPGSEPGSPATPTDPRGAAALQSAIERGQLVSIFLPKVEFRTGRVSGMETLVRWEHPTDGLLQPEEFLVTVEENGLMGALTRQVLQQAFSHARSWRDAGLDLDLAVNVSMDDLADRGFPDAVDAEAHAHGIPLTSLLLEVTEARSTQDLLPPIDTLAELKRLGVRLSLDDFGTGHSLLARTGGLGFDEIKIDRCFVHGASRDPALQSIVDMSCKLGRQLHMKVVAEGVEDRADWDMLRRTSCDQAQGYFIARPMRGDAVPAWVAAWRGPEAG